MIIKGMRVLAKDSRGRLSHHLLHGDENESVELLRGTEADILAAFADAAAQGARYALRHWIIAPQSLTSREEALAIIDRIAEEFAYDPSRGFIVEHKKKRATAGSFDVHWHVVVGEIDPGSGRVMNSSHDRVRHEFLARVAEFELGHPIVPGVHTQAVMARLLRDGRNDVAAWLDPALAREHLPREAFTHATHQAAKRLGHDLPAIRQAVRAAWLNTTSWSAFEAALTAVNLTLVPGDKRGEWIIHAQGDFVGSLRRLSGARKIDIEKRQETKHDASNEPNAIYDGTDALHAGRRNPRQSHDLGSTRTDRGDPRGGRGEPASDVDGSARPLGGRADPDPREPRGAPSPHPGARDHGGDSAGRRRSLIETTKTAVGSFRDVHKRAIVLAGTAEARATGLLDRLQRDAKAAIAETRKTAPAPSRAAVDEAAEAEARFRARADSVTVEIKALTERRHALVLEQGAPWWRRRNKFADIQTQIEEIDGEREALIARRAIWSTGFINAGAKHERAVQAYKSDVVTAKAETEAAYRKASEAIAAISSTRRILRAWPHLAHCGSASCHRSGERIAVAAKALRDPWAKDIWGLPVGGPRGRIPH